MCKYRIEQVNILICLGEIGLILYSYYQSATSSKHAFTAVTKLHTLKHYPHKQAFISISKALIIAPHKTVALIRPGMNTVAE